MRIQHNIPAMNSYRNYAANTKAVSKNLEKLSSGYRINRAGDDAAGLAISEKMRAQVTGLKTAQKNAKDGISLVQTAEGALTEVHSMLNRMVELADQSANGTFDDTTDRANLQKEISQLKSEIDRIADSTNFNGIKLLDGSLDTAVQGTGGGNGQKSVLVDGATFNNVAASSGSYTTADLTGGISAGNAGTFDFTVNYTENGVAKTKTITTASVASGTDKTVVTKAVADAIAADSTLSKLFSVEDSTGAQTYTSGALVLKGKEAGTSGPTVTSVALAASASGGYAGAITDAVEATDALAASTAGADASGTIDTTSFTTPGKSITIGNKTYEFVTSATDAVKDGSIRVLLGASADAAGANLVNAMKANGVSSASMDAGNDLIKISDLSQISVEQKGLKMDSSSDGVYINNTAATKGSYQQAIGGGANGGTFTYTVKYMLDGKEQTAQVDYTSSNVSAAANATSIANALKGNDSLSNLFDITDDGSGNISFTSKTAGSAGATIMNTQTSDTTANVVAGLTTTAAKDAGKTLAFHNADIKNGDTFTVGNKTYEFVSDLNKAPTGSGNIAVVKGSTDAETLKSVAALLKADGIDFNSDGTKIFVKDDALQPSKGLTLQIGDTAEDFNQLTISVGNMHAKNLGIADVDISNQLNAKASIEKLKNAINSVSSTRGDLGAAQNRLDHTINNLSVMTENIQDAESSIRDVDVADEMMNYTKNNILVQSAQAMLAQANQLPQGVLQLLG